MKTYEFAIYQQESMQITEENELMANNIVHEKNMTIEEQKKKINKMKKEIISLNE